MKTKNKMVEAGIGLAAHAGAGLKLSAGRHWSVDGSWRYLWTRDINSRTALIRRAGTSATTAFC